MSAEGFLSRWARLKAAPQEAPAAEPETPVTPLAQGTGPAGLSRPGLSPAVRLKAAPQEAPESPLTPLAQGTGPAGLSRPGLSPALQRQTELPPPPPPPPPIADAAALTADSDFSSFVAKNVDATVRRLAMKKLFADPHFHGHDGLDIYMGDYSLPSPVSTEMLAEMSHNKNLFASLDEAIERVDALLAAPVMAADAVANAVANAPPPETPEPRPAPPPPDQEVA